MKIEIYKFGTLLVSRPAGREAYMAFQPRLQELKDDEEIIVDFDNVMTLTPSWTDEFLTPLINKFKDRVKLVNTENASVVETLKILDIDFLPRHA